MRNKILLALLISGIIITSGRLLPQEGGQKPFLDGVVLGVVQSGTLFLELPIKEDFWGRPAGISPRQLPLVFDGDERSKLEKGRFFSRLLRDRSPQYVGDPIAYWGRKVSPAQIDTALLAIAAEFKSDQTLTFASPFGMGKARILDIQVRCNVTVSRCALFGLAKPDRPLSNDTIVVASARPFPCGSCEVLERAAELKRTDPLWQRLEASSLIGEPIYSIHAIAGHFTSKERSQYAAVVQGISDLNWKTVIFDTSSPAVEILGENSDFKFIPTAVSDLDNNGLQETWMRIQGLEGFSAGVVYYRDTQQHSVSFLTLALNGM